MMKSNVCMSIDIQRRRKYIIFLDEIYARRKEILTFAIEENHDIAVWGCRWTLELEDIHTHTHTHLIIRRMCIYAVERVKNLDVTMSVHDYSWLLAADSIRLSNKDMGTFNLSH